MKAIVIAGHRGVGKTTLIEALIPRLQQQGSVATVKSIHHDIEIDEPGKDTYRHRTAGAETVVGITPSLTFEITTDGKHSYATEDRLLDQTLANLADASVNYTLIEGFTTAPLPTITVGEMKGQEVAGEIICRLDTHPDTDLDRIVRIIQRLTEWDQSHRL